MQYRLLGRGLGALAAIQKSRARVQNRACQPTSHAGKHLNAVPKRALGVPREALDSTLRWADDNSRDVQAASTNHWDGEYTRSGVIGRPSLASAEKGKAVLASLVDSFASVLEILQGG